MYSCVSMSFGRLEIVAEAAVRRRGPPCRACGVGLLRGERPSECTVVFVWRPISQMKLPG